jgi:hypothetical protein
MKLHRAGLLPFKAKMKTALMLDDGQVNYWLDPTDWTNKEDGTPANLDGTDGQVMTILPAGYWQFVTAGDLREVRRSEVMQPAAAGWKFYPDMWIGSYEASVQRSTNKLASVVNTTADYRGGNNNAAWDAASNSLLGKPGTNISRTNFRTFARARGAGFEQYFYDAHKILWWMFVIQFATRNSQKPVVTALTTEGYHQGGLGNGVTTANSTEWNNFNTYYPFIPCGISNSLANNSGEVNYVVSDFGGAGVNRTFTVNRFNGIENPFGHIWKNLDGINIKIQADSAGGESQAWVSFDAATWNDSNYNAFTNVGLMPRANGYMSRAIFGAGGEFLPALVAGGSTIFYCDYFYTSLPASGESLRTLLVGGAAYFGSNAGFVYSASGTAPSTANTSLGSRLCFLGA